MKTIILIACLAAFATANFTDYKVYRVPVADKQQLDVVMAFEGMNGIDFWSKAHANNQDMDIMVSPQINDQFTNVLKQNLIAHKVLINNVETVVQGEHIDNKMVPRGMQGRINFDRYNTYPEIVHYLHQLQKDYPDIVNVGSIGKSYEGRSMVHIKISTGGSNKPAILIDGGIHAREWASPASAVFLIHQLVENKNNRHMIQNVDWYIIPVLNPDGYEFSHASTSTRFWRKNTAKGCGGCNGVDLNRNFGFQWMTVGASSKHCSEVYAGRKPFSEAESKNLKNFVKTLRRNIKLYLSIHSYGKYILYPWAYTTNPPKDWMTLHNLAQDVADAIYTVNSTVYAVGSPSNMLSAAAGGSDDWMKAIGRVALSYTIELPGGGSRGFDPPASAIKGIATELFEGIKVYHHYVKRKFQKLN